MSEEHAKAFWNQMAEDKDLQEKLKAVDSEEDFFKTAKGAGFDFTKEEWINVTPKQPDGDLSDADLEGAAGGGVLDFYWGNLKSIGNQIIGDPCYAFTCDSCER